jgi:GT2 family glycosyltransferase/glycosyltransferase involved in cell wall biosynthesis/SAM-dependent methyltransferase
MNDYAPYAHLEIPLRALPSDRYAATIIARVIDRVLAPASILDLGCGNGVWLDELAGDGTRFIQGVEEMAFVPRDLAVDPSCILNASLAEPLTLNRAFDLVLCLEGPDHIEPQFAQTLVDNCVRHGETVLFSTGLPGPSGGDRYEQPNTTSWIDLFRNRSFVDLDLIRPLIWHDPRIPFWYRQNLLLFVRGDSPRLPQLRAETERVASFSPLSRLEPTANYSVSFLAELDERRLRELERRLVWQAEQLDQAIAAEQSRRTEIQGLSAELARQRRAAESFRQDRQALQEHTNKLATYVRALQRDLETATAKELSRREEVRSLSDALKKERRQAATLKSERQTLQDHSDALSVYVEALQREMATATTELERAQSITAVLRQEKAIILSSTLWRATGPLRALGRALPLSLRLRLRHLLQSFGHLARSLSGMNVRRRQRDKRRASVAPAEADGEPTPARIEEQRRVVIISGEAHTPGHTYRVLRLAEAVAACGASASWMRIEDYDKRRDEVANAQIVIIWRAPYSTTTAAIMKAARNAGAKVVYDLDDLMLKPELARIDIIDGIRSQGFNVEQTALFFARVQKLMLLADICTCTTNELADHIREYQKIAYVLPNGFDEPLHLTARLAVRDRRAVPADPIVRIGYAGGSRTHQRDFGQAVPAIARILNERPECRLVLFRDRESREPIVNPAEFPALMPHRHQIEWHEMVPLERLPGEIAGFDINIVPLEAGNPFCEAKSELKYFEAALVEVCTVASHTGPLGRVIRDRITGRLVDSADAWYVALNELAGDRALRERMAHAAYLDVLWRFGPRRREELVRSLLDLLAGGDVAARAFELDLRRSNRPTPEFDIPQSEIMFRADSERPTDVSVIVPLYNYAHYVTEALESVRRQTVEDLDLVIVDDRSTDSSLQVALDWTQRNASRFNRIVVMRNHRNAGLARSRNVGFDNAETPFVLPLDADNRLLPHCAERMLATLRSSRAAFAYPKIQCFGDSKHVIGDEAFSPVRFSGGNYVDAMALISKWAWAAVGGYAHIQSGWEDYDFWCRCVEHGFWGLQVPEVLAEYRVHKKSMLSTQTDRHENKLKLIRDLNAGHSWLSIPYRG